MATATSSAIASSCQFCCSYLLLLLFLVLLPLCARCRSSDDEGASFALSFDGNRTLGTDIELRGGAEIRGSAVVLGGAGRMESRRPVRFFGARPGFSTDFSFASAPSGGDGPSFFLAPAVVSSKANGTESSPPPAAIQVGFAAGMNRKGGNFSGTFIRIRVGDQDLIRSKDLSGIVDGRGGKKLHAWIDYDGDTKTIQVRLSTSSKPRPRNSTMSYQIDLSNVLWREAMLVGMGSSNTASSPQICSIYGWSFATRRGTPYLMHSEPLDPETSLVAVRPFESSALPDDDDRPGKGRGGEGRSKNPWGTIAGLLLAAACGALVTFLVMFVWFAATARRPMAFVEYPVHPVADVVYDKIVVVGKEENDLKSSSVSK